MNNQAVIAKITAIRKHSNADKLQIATVLGHDVVVGLDYNVGEVGVYFPEGVQLSTEYCNANSLIRYTDPVTGEKKGGFFEESRRVRAQKFRGEKSDGYFARLGSLQALGLDIQEEELGLEFDVLGGIPICCKYISPATQRAIKMREKQEQKQKKPKRLIDSFLKHKETGFFKKEVSKIVIGSLVIVTEKLHGCVLKGTIVNTLEYGDMVIEDIVDPKLKCHVKTLNISTNEVEYSKVDDWYFYPNDTDWYEVELDDGTLITITGNNPVWMPELKCYRKVENLVSGDYLLLDSQ